MKISELKMSVRKEIIENDNNLVALSLSKVGENEFLQTLWAIDKVESSYCHYSEMLKLLKNKWKDRYIFSCVVTYESLPASLQSFKKTLQNHFEKSPGDVMVYDEHSSFVAVKKCW